MAKLKTHMRLLSIYVAQKLSVSFEYLHMIRNSLEYLFVKK